MLSQSGSLKARLRGGEAHAKYCPFVLAILSSILFASPAFATAPHLASITPAGGQRGTELQISLNGDRLQDAEEIICYEPGLEVKRLNLVTNKVVKAQLKISPECRLGEHHLRLRTASGLSVL